MYQPEVSIERVNLIQISYISVFNVSGPFDLFKNISL